MLIENMFMLGLILVVVIGILYYSTSFTLKNYKERQAEDAVGNLLITARAVHELGPGNQDSAYVSLPTDVDLRVTSQELIAENDDGTINVSVSTPFDVVGSVIPVGNKGTVPVRAINSSLVKIGQWTHITNVAPFAIEFVTLPQIIFIYGEDIPSTVKLLVNGQLYTQGSFFYVNSSAVWFRASPSKFQSNPNQNTTYYLSLNNTATKFVTNSLPFIVIGP
jgi:hypothetical protein